MFQTNSVSQGLTYNYFTEQCIPPMVSSPKINKTISENLMPQADGNIDTKIKKNMTKNSLEWDEYSSTLKSLSSAKLKAKFNIFLRRKIEVEAELEELLCSEKDDSVQPATLKLREIDLKARLTSLGVDKLSKS